MDSIMLNNIPTKWKIEYLGQIFSEKKEKVNDKDYKPLSVTKNGIVPQLKHVVKTNDGDNRKKVNIDDFVINSRSDRKGSSGLSRYTGSVSLINIVLQAKHGYLKFLHYLLKSYAFQEEFYRFGRGIVADLWTTRFSELKGIQIGLPDYQTQKEIADFLDKKTAIIDQLIEKKQMFLKKIDEKGKAIIIYAILGKNDLNCSVSCLDKSKKESLLERVYGVKLPDNWKLEKIHNIFRVRTKNKNTGMHENNLLSLSYGKVIRKNINSSTGLLPENYETYQIVYPGDIILRLTDLQNDKRSIRQGLVLEKGIITSAYDAVYVSKDHSPRFWAYTLLSLDLAKYYYSLEAGVRQSIKFKDFYNESILTPSKNRQEEIADFIDKALLSLNQTAQKIKKSISLLNELRSSLITHAVTGQLDIKKWKNRGLSERHIDKIEKDMTS
jgi:type I restriction enzyme S subunit